MSEITSETTVSEITSETIAHSCHSVEVEVEGSHPGRMQAEALSSAANFFQVPPNQLRIGLWTAEPYGYSMSGSPMGWKAHITITLDRE